MKSWMTVCRYNQARSIVAAATLRHFYPSHHVESAGIEARENQGIPSTVSQIAQMWGLNQYERTSTSLKPEAIRGSQKRILAADSFVQEFIKNLVEDCQIDNLVNLADQKSLEPVDPSGMDIDNLALELSKVVVLTLRWAAKQSDFQSEIYGILVDKRIEFKSIVNDFGQENTVFIDSNLARPLSSTWGQDNTPILFNPRSLENFDFSTLGNRRISILQSGFEIDDHERIFLSKKWLEFLLKLTKISKVVIVSDLSEAASMPKPASILALSHTQSTKNAST